jgi:hypothetical protein
VAHSIWSIWCSIVSNQREDWSPDSPHQSTQSELPRRVSSPQVYLRPRSQTLHRVPRYTVTTPPSTRRTRRPEDLLSRPADGEKGTFSRAREIRLHSLCFRVLDSCLALHRHRHSTHSRALFSCHAFSLAVDWLTALSVAFLAFEGRCAVHVRGCGLVLQCAQVCGTLTRHWDRCGECRAWRELRGLLGEVRLMVRFYGDYLIVCLGMARCGYCESQAV